MFFVFSSRRRHTTCYRDWSSDVGSSDLATDRRPIETGDPSTIERIVVLGWVDGASPDPDRHPSAPPRHLSAVPYLAWAACLAMAWPDPAADPYPGRPFRREDILRTCVELGAPHNAVAGALDTILPSTGLVIFV